MFWFKMIGYTVAAWRGKPSPLWTFTVIDLRVTCPHNETQIWIHLDQTSVCVCMPTFVKVLWYCYTAGVIIIPGNDSHSCLQHLMTDMSVFGRPFNIWSSKRLRGHPHPQEAYLCTCLASSAVWKPLPPPRLLGTTMHSFLDHHPWIPQGHCPKTVSRCPSCHFTDLNSCMVSTLRPMVKRHIPLPVLQLTLPSGYEAVYPRWHQQCQRPCYCWYYITIVSRQRPLNISRAFFFYWVCWVTTDVALGWSNCAGMGLTHTKGEILPCSYPVLSHQPIFSGTEKIKRFSFSYEATKTNQLTGCQRKFLHVTNCQEKLAAGHVYLIRTVSKTNTATADMEIWAVCAEVPTWQITRPCSRFFLSSFQCTL